MDQTNDLILDEGAGLASGDVLEPRTAAAIEKTARWARYYLYIMLAYFALLLLFSVLGIGGAATAGAEAAAAGIVSTLFSFGIMLLLVGYPLYKLWGFTSKAPRALRTGSQETLTEAVSNMRSVYKFTGIVMIVTLAIYALAILFALVAGGAALLG